MTTIACNLKEIAGDTRVTWEGIGTDAFSGIKIFPAKNGAIYGVTGENCAGSIRAIEWLQGDRLPEYKPQPPEYEHDWSWRLIELSADGIALYNEYLERERTFDPILAVGSGRKVAIYCMRYLHMTPAEAVHEACKVDHWSQAPVFTASLAEPEVVRWKPAPKKRAPLVLRTKKQVVHVLPATGAEG